MPNLTICICTFNRLSDLRRALASVRAGEEQPFEILVSDDASDPSVELLCKEYGAVYVRGPGRGLSANRNSSMAHATGDLICFIDDDVTVSPTFVSVARRLPLDQVTTGHEKQYANNSSFDVEPRNADWLGFQRVEIGPTDIPKSVVINATVIPLTLARAICFDERSKYGYEELDFARAVASRGVAIVRDADLWVNHWKADTARDGRLSAMNLNRIYFGFKDLAFYKERPIRAIAFVLVAWAHATVRGASRRSMSMSLVSLPLVVVARALSYRRVGNCLRGDS